MRKIISSNRVLVVSLLLSIALLFMIGVSLSFGAVAMTPAQLWQGILRKGDTLTQTIIWDLRLPRTLAAMLVGAALGMSGALLQGMLRNGLADPFLLSISAGAGLVVVPIITLGVLQSWVPLAAWIGSLLTTIFVYFLARSGDGVSIERLILGGVATSSLFGTIQSVLLLLADDGRVQAALNWLTHILHQEKLMFFLHSVRSLKPLFY